MATLQLQVLLEAKNKAELLAHARARHIERLEAELGRITTEAALQTASAADAETIAKLAAEKAESRAAEALNQCQHAVKKAAESERMVNHLKRQLEQNAADLADARMQLELQAQRLRDLEDSSFMGRILRQHDTQLKQIQSDHESVRQRLMAELESACQRIEVLQRQAPATDTPLCSETCTADNDWNVLFEEPSQLPENGKENENSDNYPDEPSIANSGWDELAAVLAEEQTKARTAQLAAAELALRIHHRQQQLEASLLQCDLRSHMNPIIPREKALVFKSDATCDAPFTQQSSPGSTPTYGTPCDRSTENSPRSTAPSLPETSCDASNSDTTDDGLEESFQRLSNLVQGILNVHKQLHQDGQPRN